MCSTRVESLKWLGTYLAQNVPELENNICVIIGAPGHKLEYPSLAISANRFSYSSEQAQEMETFPDKVTMKVGLYEGVIELKINSATVGQRYALEEKVTQLFLSTELAPGILTGTVTSCVTFGPFSCDFELINFEWENERALERKYESSILVRAIIPALTTRRAYNVDELVIGLDEVPTTDEVDEASEEVDENTAFVTNATFEVFKINDDGTWSIVEA